MLGYADKTGKEERSSEDHFHGEMRAQVAPKSPLRAPLRQGWRQTLSKSPVLLTKTGGKPGSGGA